MAVHSKCHPGKPLPKEVSHSYSPPLLENFHTAKSALFFLPVAFILHCTSPSSLTQFKHE